MIRNVIAVLMAASAAAEFIGWFALAIFFLQGVITRAESGRGWVVANPLTWIIHGGKRNPIADYVLATTCLAFWSLGLALFLPVAMFAFHTGAASVVLQWKNLLPLIVVIVAASGLRRAGISSKDADKYFSRAIYALAAIYLLISAVIYPSISTQLAADPRIAAMEGPAR